MGERVRCRRCLSVCDGHGDRDGDGAMIDEETIGRLMLQRAMKEGHRGRLPSMQDKPFSEVTERTRVVDDQVFDALEDDWTMMHLVGRRSGVAGDKLRDSLWRLVNAGRAEGEKLAERVWQWRRIK